MVLTPLLGNVQTLYVVFRRDLFNTLQIWLPGLSERELPMAIACPSSFLLPLLVSLGSSLLRCHVLWERCVFELLHIGGVSGL